LSGVQVSRRRPAPLEMSAPLCSSLVLFVDEHLPHSLVPEFPSLAADMMHDLRGVVVIINARHTHRRRRTFQLFDTTDNAAIPRAGAQVKPAQKPDCGHSRCWLGTLIPIPAAIRRHARVEPLGCLA